jgi:polysaccharide chain length determinant protein (PEP-CTERM system associated)
MNNNNLPARRTAAMPKGNAITLTPSELTPILIGEAKRHRLTLVLIFAGIALLALIAGLVMPKNYSAATTILAQESDIIQPLLDGRAVATEVTDRAGIARQVIYSRKVLSDALETGGWLKGNPSPLKQDRLMEELKGRIAVTSPRPNLIQIAYHDSDAKRTFQVTERLAAMFIQESMAAKERESREAYEFIDSRVNDYHTKLTDAEDKLRYYRVSNSDAQPGSSADSNTRIGSLRTQVEQTRMQLMEQRSRVDAISSQLSGESAVTAVQTRETLYRGQLLELQAQLDQLLLNDTEQHPDVVRIRHQMADLQQALTEEQQRRAAAPQGSSPFDQAQLNPLYQELRSQQAQAQRDAAATQSRLDIAESMLNAELDRSRRIAESESALAELNRDYEVNRDIYQDLLRRRENARVSMELDREKRGLTLRIQDPATMPLRPSGLRFLHVAGIGLFLAIALPIGLLFLRGRFDPRIFSTRQLQQATELTLLTTIPTYHSAQDRRQLWKNNTLSIGILIAIVVAYALVFGFKQINAG